MTLRTQAEKPRANGERTLRRTRSKLVVLGSIGALLIALALGARGWWVRGAPERAALHAALDRQRAFELRLSEAQAAVAAAPGDWKVYDSLASVLLAGGQADEAFVQWRKGTQVAPGNREAWQSLANGYLAERRLAAAEETYAEIARRWPKSPDGYVGMAVVHRHSGRFREALKAARAAVRYGPGFPENHYVLGAVIEELGKQSPHPAGETALLEEGRRHLIRAGKAQPNHPDIDYRRGRICLLVRRYDEARTALESAVRLTPRRTVAWLALADARLRSGNLDGSIQAAHTARELGPTEPEAALALGRALLLKSDRPSLEAAAAAFEDAVRLKPDSAQARQRLGTALLRLDRVREAGAAFEAAHRLDRNNAYAPQQLAQIYQRLGDPERAASAARVAATLALNESILAQLQRAGSLHPENPLIHRALGDRYRELGWLQPAANEYQAALEITPDDAKARAALAAVRRAFAAQPSQ